MEKRRTFLLLVLLSVVAAWAFTIYTQRELEAMTLRHKNAEAKQRIFAQDESGAWGVQDPDGSGRIALHFDPSSKNWLGKEEREDSGIAAFLRMDSDVLEMRGHGKVRLLSPLLEVFAELSLPEGEELKAALISPDRSKTLFEMQSGHFWFFHAGSCQLLEPPAQLLQGSSRISLGWAYMGFQAQDDKGEHCAVLLDLATASWKTSPGWIFVGVNDAGLATLANGSEIREVPFESLSR